MSIDFSDFQNPAQILYFSPGRQAGRPIRALCTRENCDNCRRPVGYSRYRYRSEKVAPSRPFQECSPAAQIATRRTFSSQAAVFSPSSPSSLSSFPPPLPPLPPLFWRKILWSRACTRPLKNPQTSEIKMKSAACEVNASAESSSEKRFFLHTFHAQARHRARGAPSQHDDDRAEKSREETHLFFKFICQLAPSSCHACTIAHAPFVMVEKIRDGSGKTVCICCQTLLTSVRCEESWNNQKAEASEIALAHFYRSRQFDVLDIIRTQYADIYQFLLYIYIYRMSDILPLAWFSVISPLIYNLIS